MAGELLPAAVRGGLPADPRRIRTEQAKADAIIQYAARVKDWPLLEQAVDLKIEQQREFVQWWDETVHRKGGGPWLDNAEPRYLSLAEVQAEITQQQVSRWRKRLADEVKYREQQILAVKAGLEPAKNFCAAGTGGMPATTCARWRHRAGRICVGETISIPKMR